MALDARQLDGRIVAMIRSGGASEPFDALADDLLDYQLDANPLYRDYCDELARPTAGGAPADPAANSPRPPIAGSPRWPHMPAFWPIAWRLADIRCFPAEQAVAVFVSSGTSGGHDGGRSRHFFDADTLGLYREALAGPFAAALLAEPDRRGPLLALMPSPEQAPQSSLSFMLGEAISRFGQPDSSGFFVEDGQMRLDAFAAAVGRIARRGLPMVLASTAFGWVTLLESLQRALPLPPGSRLMETGGYKGRSAQWPREQLYARLADAFAIEPDTIVSEYGMCELSSQFYSAPPPGDPPGEEATHFAGPPWVRVLAVDPETQSPVAPGQAGLLRIIDLANRGSTIAVQTEDLAIVTGPRSFHLLGRAPSAPAKGCSLSAEDLLGRP